MNEYRNGEFLKLETLLKEFNIQLYSTDGNIRDRLSVFRDVDEMVKNEFKRRAILGQMQIASNSIS